MSNVPEIRFKGFTDAWEQRKFEDDITLVGGATPFKQNADYWGGDIVWLSSQEIKEKYVASGTYTITKKALDDNATKAVKSGTPLIVTRSGVLANRFPISIPTVDVAINQDIKALIYDTDKINTDYFVAYLQKLEDFILKWVVKGGTTVQSVNVPDLQKMELGYPSVEEQTRIGEFFRTLDECIATSQHKLNGLKQLKSAYLQQMFPQAGETVPRVRFAGFSGEWEERRLGDISVKVSEKNKNNTFIETLTNSAERGIISQRDFFDKDISNEKNLGSYFVVRPDDFVYNPRISNFAPVGPIKRNLLGRTGVMSPLYYVFRVVEGDLTFIEKYFESVYWHEFMKMNGDNGVRSDRFNIKDSTFEQMPIPFPDIQEQNTIGKYFYTLDLLVAVQSQKLDKLNQIKEAYLQKMFI